MAHKELAVDSVAETYLALLAGRERVEDPAALPAALERAVRAVTVEKRQALRNVICRRP